MGNELDPIVGNWYTHLDKGEPFRVVGFDEEASVIEIQRFDGDLEEIELESWADLNIEPAAEPEDWTGPADDVESDDLGYTETDMSAGDWRESTADAHGPADEEWEDARSEDERDEWAEGDAAEEQPGPDFPDDVTAEPPSS